MVSKSVRKRVRTGRPSYVRRQKLATPPVPLPLPEAGETAIAPVSSPASPAPCERCSTVEPHRHCLKCGTRLDGRECGVCGTSALESKTDIPAWARLHDDSKIRDKALQIVALELGGKSRAEIATFLGITEGTLRTYLTKAAANGWIDFDNPKDAIEFRLLPKSVTKLREALDDETRHTTSGMTVAQQTALKLVEGTVFKQFEQAPAAAGATLIGVKIEIVGGDKGELREGTVLGADSYIDAETVQE